MSKKAVRLDELTPAQRRLVLALVGAAAPRLDQAERDIDQGKGIRAAEYRRSRREGRES